MACFLSRQQTFSPNGLPSEEAIKTNAITQCSTSLLKFTIVTNKFFVGKDMLKETFLKMGTLSVEARAYSREIKTNNMNYKNAAMSPL